MLAIRSLSRSGASAGTRRHLVTSAQKRALNKQQLEGEPKKASSGGGDHIKPASVPPASDGTGTSTGGSGGGGGLMMGVVLLAGGAGAAYYNDLIPQEYLPDFMKDMKESSAKRAEKREKISSELKEAVKEVKAKQAAEETPAEETTTEEPEKVEHPENGNRVTNDKINSFYTKVNDGKAKEEEQSTFEKAQESATKATQYNEGETVSITKEVNTTLPTSASAIRELQTKSHSETSTALASAQASLRSDLDETFLKDIDSLSPSQLRTRLIQLVAEMSDRTKWEAVRLQEFLSLKEKEVGEKYLEILQKQRLEYEDLLAQRIREAEDSITRQANEALRAKEEGVQNLLGSMRQGREREVADATKVEVTKIRDELELEFQNKFQNELGQMKQMHINEVEKYAERMTKMQGKLADLESSLQISRQYESGSKKAHAVSAAALALANKLENGESVEVEVAALQGATAGEEEGVIASAVKMIPRGIGNGKQILSLGELQSAFDKSYKKGREVSLHTKNWSVTKYFSLIIRSLTNIPSGGNGS